MGRSETTNVIILGTVLGVSLEVYRQGHLRTGIRPKDTNMGIRYRTRKREGVTCSVLEQRSLLSFSFWR